MINPDYEPPFMAGANEEFQQAVMKLLGLTPEDNVVAITIHCEVGYYPTVTVARQLITNDGLDLANVEEMDFYLLPSDEDPYDRDNLEDWADEGD